MTISISHSEMQQWARCPRKWYIGTYLAYTPADQNPANVRDQGSRIHAALDAHFGHGIDPLGALTVQYKMEIGAHPEYEAELRAEMDTSLAMVEGYLEWLASTGQDADYRVVATERDVQVPLPGVPGVMLRAKLDQVVLEESTGILRFRDFKTGTNFETADALALDPQMKTYSLIQRLAVMQQNQHLHDDDGTVEGCPGCFSDHLVVSGGLMDSLRRVKRGPKAVPPFYRRDAFTYSPEEIKSTLARVRKLCGEIVAARAWLDELYASRPSLDAVNRMQRTICRPVPIPRDCKWSCPFVTLCPLCDDGSDWPGMLTTSGRFEQVDPYARYAEDAVGKIRDGLAKL